MGKQKKARISHAEVVRLFGARLREVRLSRGMTQAQLAQKAEVSVAYVGRLEAGAAAPGIDLAARLAKALGAALPELLPAGDPPDTVAVLRDQASFLFEALLKTADRETLLLLNPLLRLLQPGKGK